MAAERRRRISVWLLILAGIYVVVCMVVFAAQRKLVYFPARELTATPADAGVPFEDVEFSLADGTKCHGWWLPHPKPIATLIYCHGNGGNISGRVGILERLHALSLSIFIFDYPGYGQSGGAPTEASIDESALLAWQHVRETRQVPSEKIVLWGRSLGGGVAVTLASRKPCAAVVIESSFLSAPDIGQRAYPFFPVKLLMQDRFDSAAKIAQVTVPKLHLHSRSDEVVLYASGRALFELAPEPKRFVELHGGHNDPPEATGAEAAAREFLRGLFR
ncbi:MAG: alpha/beta hydrolase [Planctomycetes bacterium]|jgi:hypothetical protein|nr:alpha/beta hydrolase [Planctomycetota bacterium]